MQQSEIHINLIEALRRCGVGLAASLPDDWVAPLLLRLTQQPDIVQINFKLPGGDGFREHQDVQAGWDEFADIHITAMIALDQTNEANGSLEVIAGMHRQGVLGSMWAPLTDEDTKNVDYLAVHCQPGDAVFFDSYAPHRSQPNHTAKARRVLYITYNKLGQGDSRERYYTEKRNNYPPDIERDPGREYSFRV